MNWKSFLYKIIKGAVSGVTATAGAMLMSGIPMTGHAWAILGGSVASAALHGATNAMEQMKEPA